MLQKERPYNSRHLIDWFFADVGVDVDEHVLRANRHKGLCRTFLTSWIDEDVQAAWKKALLDPFGHDGYVNFISGDPANGWRMTKERREERMADISDQTTEIEAPKKLTRIQDYMNGRGQSFFSHGSYGVFREENLQDAIDAARDIDDEGVRDQQLSYLYHARAHPQPLYKRCDRFPRLKADHWNQTINLASCVRPTLYCERDREVDLTKAHLAGFVAVAKSEGLEVPRLEKALDASLSGADLWRDIASYLDEKELPDAHARRSAVKKTYALVYGSSVANFLYELKKAYASATGTELKRDEAVEDVLDHPVIEEILQVRSEIEDRINEQGGLEAADSRFIPLSPWDDVKAMEDRWRGCLAYVNASYEMELMWEVFQIAIQEEEAATESGRRLRFQIWLLQGDGCTIRFRKERSAADVIRKMKEAVADRADELGMPAALEVQNNGG
jgi:hypothetical protein